MKKFIQICSEKLAKDLGCDVEDIFVVWSCKVIQNKKAILGSTKSGSPLIEATLDGDRDRIYYDVYMKERKEIIVLNPQNDSLADTIVTYAKGRVKKVPKMVRKLTGLLKRKK